MSAPINDGGPAYPHSEFSIAKDYGNAGFEFHEAQPGMTLRDWFAGMALTSMRGIVGTNDETTKWAAAESYKIADAMISARDRKESE